MASVPSFWLPQRCLSIRIFVYFVFCFFCARALIASSPPLVHFAMLRQGWGRCCQVVAVRGASGPALPRGKRGRRRLPCRVLLLRYPHRFPRSQRIMTCANQMHAGRAIAIRARKTGVGCAAFAVRMRRTDMGCVRVSGGAAPAMACTAPPGSYCAAGCGEPSGEPCPQGFFCPGGTSDKKACEAPPGPEHTLKSNMQRSSFCGAFAAQRHAVAAALWTCAALCCVAVARCTVLAARVPVLQPRRWPAPC